ncbi:hypothetical protein A3K73_02190 [Candidatus Pacearchaeota archaeon RBG_13_36_9]|nr:MAG: hypothetical protein A3K73_02190 [Candidatus Pacearchaeota archaeon RBG_13_36_9]
MKIQLAYKFTGENKEELQEILQKVIELLRDKGHETYAPIFDFSYEGKTKEEIYTGTLDKLDESDAMFVLIRGEEKSEGMLVELGYAIAKKKKIILAIKKGIESRTRYYAQIIIEFRDIPDMLNKLKKLEIR